MQIKNNLKYFLPPFIIDVGLKTKKVFTRKSTPKWETIINGLLKDYKLYVNKDNRVFRDMLYGEYDYFFWDYLKKFNLDNTTILDVGGHIGYHTLGFSKLVGQKGKIIVFEPNIYNSERLEMNLKKNKVLNSKYKIYKVALSNKNETTTFNFSKNVDNMESSGGYIEDSKTPLSSDKYKKLGFTSTPVTSNTLDRVLKGEKVNKLSLIKIDVEGAEQLVLEGSINTIKEHKPNIILEVHSIVSMFWVLKFLFESNYSMKILKEDSNSRCFIAAEPK